MAPSDRAAKAPRPTVMVTREPAGAWAAYVPHDLTWSYEHAEEPQNEPRYARIAHLGLLPELLDRLETEK